MLDFDSMDKSKTYRAVYHGGGYFDVVKGSAVTLEYNESFAKYKHSSGWLAYDTDGFGFYVKNGEAPCFTLLPEEEQC